VTKVNLAGSEVSAGIAVRPDWTGKACLWGLATDSAAARFKAPWVEG